MPKISLLKTRTVEYENDDDLKKLIHRMKCELNAKIDMLDHPATDAAINAISFNLVRLMRERERYKKEPTSLVVLDGGKKN